MEIAAKFDLDIVQPGIAAVKRGSVLVLLLLFVAFADDTASGIVGRWRSLETSKGGIGALYDFHTNGVVAYSPGAIVEISYRVEGDQFVFGPSTTNAAPEQKQSINWFGENRFRVGSGDQAAELTRKGERTDSNNALTGEWSGTKNVGDHKVDTHWFFYPAGRGLLLIPFQPQQGRYTVKESTIRIELPHADPTEYRFEVKGDVLTMSKISKAGEDGQARFARY